MKFCCIICSEYVVANDTVSATTCGHIFHNACLFQWFRHHFSCPQCRKAIRADKDVILKLYFEPGPDAQSEEDVEALKNHINELEAQMLLCQSESTRCNGELVESKVQNKDLKSKLKESETTVRTVQETLDSLRVQLSFMSNENKQLNESKRQLAQMKTKLSEYETIQKLINDSSSEIEQMKLEGTAGKQWMVVSGVLKKTLNQANLENNQLKIRVKNLNSECQRIKREYQRKIEKMAEEQSKLTCIRPSATVSKALSPNVVAEVAAAANGDEYKMEMNGKENGRRLKSKISPAAAAACLGSRASMALSPVVSPLIPIDQLNIMKRRRLEAKGLQRSKTVYGGYDGMGGHSKPDVFPTGKRLG